MNTVYTVYTLVSEEVATIDHNDDWSIGSLYTILITLGNAFAELRTSPCPQKLSDGALSAYHVTESTCDSTNLLRPTKSLLGNAPTNEASLIIV